MRLFDFVEKDNGVGAAAHGFSQLAAFFEPDVSGRRADKAGNRVFFLVFGHIDANHGVFVIEKGLGQRAGEFRLADTGRTQEDERADRAIRILEAAAGTENGIGHGFDGLVLSDNTTVQLFLQIE